MHIEILDDAQDDMLTGALFYEAQQHGLGDYFIDSISSDIESLHIYAGVHERRFGYYILHSKRFPYTVYYEIKEATIKVVAVFGDRRNPEKLEKRFKGN